MLQSQLTAPLCPLLPAGYGDVDFYAANVSRNAEARRAARRRLRKVERRAAIAAITSELDPGIDGDHLVVTFEPEPVEQVTADDACWTTYEENRLLRIREAVRAEIAAEQAIDDAHALAGITTEFDPEELQWAFTVSTRPPGSNGRRDAADLWLAAAS